jgi:hypothetical protein
MTLGSIIRTIRFAIITGAVIALSVTSASAVFAAPKPLTISQSLGIPGAFDSSNVVAYAYSGESVISTCGGTNCTLAADHGVCHNQIARSLNRLINGYNTVQTGTITFYLNETTNSCSSNDPQIIDLPATTQFQDIQVPVTGGFSWEWSANPTDTVLITYS